MSIVLNPWSRPDEWVDRLQALLPDEEIHLWPSCPDRDAVEFVVAGRMKRSDLATFPRLCAILSMGAGVEQWRKDGIPDVDIVRLSDPTMADEMATYALHWVVRLQRHFDVMEEHSDQRLWEPVPYVQSRNHRVGVLGYGTIGGRIGSIFTELGYPVNAWSRSGADDDSVTSYRGSEQLDAFLGNSDVVINVLPETQMTTGLLDAQRLGCFADGAVFINIGRGTVLSSEADLLDALDTGPLRAAVLDVTDPEPPPASSPLFADPRIHLTPHVAGSTQVASASQLIADNIGRIRRGERPFPLLDPSRGY